MASSVSDLLNRIRDVEEQLEEELAKKRRDWLYRFEANRIRFEHEIRKQHRRLKKSVPRFLRDTRDLWFTVYQRICFSVYRIPSCSGSVPRMTM